MSRPLLIDAYCKEGGASMGYHLAGFEVVGVDIEPQPNYPFEFHQGDALKIVPELAERYRPAAVAGSPPCPAYCALNIINKREYPRLVEPTRAMFQALGVPYVIENVPGAPLREPLILCGSSFGLGVRRHRLFESNVWLWGLPCEHPDEPAARVYGLVDDDGRAKVSNAVLAAAGDAMGIDWMTPDGLSNAIPPAYTEFIGEQIISQLRMEVAA